jgi:hypothetical protein
VKTSASVVCTQQVVMLWTSLAMEPAPIAAPGDRRVDPPRRRS